MFAPGIVSMMLSIALAAAPDLAPPPAEAPQPRTAIAAPAPTAPRRVMTWVPPYATAESLAALKRKYAGVGPGNSITHLALQFWWPTGDGRGLQYSTDGNVSDHTVKTFVSWARQHKIKVLLCVYNAVPNWNWSRAKKAFAENPATFVAALTSEVKRLKLDGVDIDFEGNDVQTDGEFDGDKRAYVAFIKALGTELHKSKKELTVDAFPYIYNAPNSKWWSAIFPHVDGLTSMGYSDIGRNGKAWASYRWQLKHAGKNAAKLQIGLPSDISTWQGNNAADQTAWFSTEKKVGIAIWDAQFSGTAWRQAPVWRNLHQLRQGK